MRTVVKASVETAVASRETSSSIGLISRNVEEAFDAVNEIVAMAREIARPAEEVSGNALERRARWKGLRKHGKSCAGLRPGRRRLPGVSGPDSGSFCARLKQENRNFSSGFCSSAARLSDTEGKRKQEKALVFTKVKPK